MVFAKPNQSPYLSTINHSSNQSTEHPSLLIIKKVDLGIEKQPGQRSTTQINPTKHT